MNQIIYLDNAATTKTAPEVVEAMLPYFSQCYGNPSSIYSLGTQSKKAVAEAREFIAGSLGAANNEIYFTAGGSEADNWAIKATADAYASRGKHIITSRIEHHAVLHTCEYLEKKGYEITYVNVDENGIIRLDELEAAIRPDTILISVMFANNEIGTIQPIKEIGAIAKAHGVLFHTDAVQAYGQRPQAERPQGSGLPLHQEGNQDSFLCAWRAAGERQKGRDRKRSRYCRSGRCIQESLFHYGGENEEGSGASGLSDPQDRGRDPLLPPQRRQTEAPSQQCEFQLSVY